MLNLLCLRKMKLHDSVIFLMHIETKTNLRKVGGLRLIYWYACCENPTGNGWTTRWYVKRSTALHIHNHTSSLQ